MYDKSKKTWSQRLKIHKNEKTQQQATNNGNSSSSNNTSIAPLATTKPQNNNDEATTTLNVAYNNVNSSTSSSSRISMPQYQLTPATIMHLPQLSDYHHHNGGGGSGGGSSAATYEYMPNHLGRSMKYAEPWLYGTVRGIPTRPPVTLYHPAHYAHYAGHPHAATIFAAPNAGELPTGATAMAVVLCSCPEYLSGTKGRNLKKPSLCKKCKGTRLPLANIGGTVRVQTSSKLRPVGAASTVRVVSSTKKSRPTILDPQKDPYDLMRRTRLLSPEPGSNGGGSGGGGSGGGGLVSSKDKSRNRGRSISPIRGRSRTRHQHHHKALISNSTQQVESSKVLETLDDSWLTETEDLANQLPSTSNRKSILRCNVNPYDLISVNQQTTNNNHNHTSSSSSSNMASNAKSNESLAKEHSKKGRKQKLQFSQNEFMPPNDDFNVQDAALNEDEPPFRSRSNKSDLSKLDIKKLKEEITPPSSTSPLNKKPNYANVQAIAGQRISLGEEQQSPKSLLQQNADGIATYESFNVETENMQKSKETEKSTKPRPDSLQVLAGGEPKRPPRSNKNQHENENKEMHKLEDAEDEELMVTVTVTPTYNIKSILKRPTSKTSENGEITQPDSPSKTPSLPSTPKQREGSTSSSKNGTPTNSRRNQVTISNSPTANSQFYIPLPQARKKVQFLVEDNLSATYREIQDEEDDDNNSSSSSPLSLLEDTKANYEYYNKKRNQKKLDTMELNHNSEDSEMEIITYDEKFIQAMLLEKLQLDSEMVTKRYNNHNITSTPSMENVSYNNNKSDYEDVFPNHSQQSKLKFFHKQLQQNDAEEEDDEKNLNELKINENLSQDKQQSTAATTLATTTSATPSSASDTTTTNSSSSSTTNSNSSSATLQSSTSAVATTHSRIKDMSDKTDDMMVVECLASKEKIFSTGLQESVDDEDEEAMDENYDNDYDDNNDDEGHQNDDDVAVGITNAIYNVDINADIVTSSSYADIDVNIAANHQQHDDHNKHHHHHHHNDKNQNDDNVNVSLSSPTSAASAASSTTSAQQNGATKSTVSDYDDEAKIKQQLQQKYQQQQQQLKNSKNEFKKDIQTLAATDKRSLNSRTSIKETQSRNPIRRSQSERQPTTTYHNSSNNRSSNNSSSNSSNNNKSYNHKNIEKTGGHVSNVNENIIPNTRNSLKDIEFVSNIKDNRLMEGNDGVVIVRANKTSVQFQDTMALRNRYNRNDTRDLFTLTLLERPREPPPPPPTSSAAAGTTSSPTPTSPPSPATMTTVATPLSNSLPKAKDLKESSKSITLATDALEETCQQQQQLQQTVNGLQLEQQQQQHQQQNESNPPSPTPPTNNTIFSKEINGATFNEGKEKYQQQMVGIAKTLTAITMTNGEKTTTDISSLVDNNERSKGAATQTLLTSTPKQQQPQRTVVRVAPFNKNSFEVHRLKISHTDSNEDYFLPSSPHTPRTPNTPNSVYSNNSSTTSSHYSVTDLSTLSSNHHHDYGQQKTSILINGDDCYSTMNLSCDDSSTPLYQSSVVVTDSGCLSNLSQEMEGLKVTNTYNTVTINLSSPRSSEDELIQQHNQLNNLLKRQTKSSLGTGSIRAIIPIRGTLDINLQRSASSTSSTSTSSITSSCSSTSSSSSSAAAVNSNSKRGKTLIRLDYDKEKLTVKDQKISTTLVNEMLAEEEVVDTEWLPHETELLKILRNPVEAVKRNLVPHICKLRETDTQKDAKRSKKMNDTHSDITDSLVSNTTAIPITTPKSSNKSLESSKFIGKLLEDPMLQQVAEGLETDTVAELIENSLKRLQESRNALDMTGTKDNEDMNRLIDISLKRLQEERHSSKDTSTPLNSSSSTAASTYISQNNNNNSNLLTVPSLTKEEERLSNRGSISSANSFASAHNYELFDFEAANESDCYQSCSSEINSLLEDDTPSAETKSKFYQMLVDATLQEIELSTSNDDAQTEEHQYESIRHNIDPIYEEISDMPPPLPLTAPPLNDPELEKKSARSIFEGASKYDILSYLVDAKERGLVKEEPFDYPLNCSNPIIIEEESSDTLSDLGKLSKLKRIDTISSRSSIMSDSSDDNQSSMSSLSPPSTNNFMLLRNNQTTSDIERNDSGVGSETSKSSRSKYLNPSNSNSSSLNSSSNLPHQRSSPLHLCEDCDGPVETQLGENGLIFAPLVCRKCGKKRVERKEIITEVVETEEKYGRDLQIILEEFCHPMFVAGLLTQEQLSAIFLNTEELLENNQTLAERMRDGLDIALEQGDDDLLTVNIGKIFLDSTQMLHAFESYCVRQAGASLLLANLEKEKELLRIFLKVSQMENAVLRRMNLNSFLMVPVQRVTKYPLLLARLYKVTPAHLEGRDQLKQAQEKIELHLNHINQEAKDVPTKLWRRISSSSPNRRASCEIDMINIKLRKMAIDVLEWNHDEVRFVMEGKLLYTQPTDSNWKKARTIKLTTVNALLVTNGKPSTNYKAEKVMSDKLNFPKHTGIREASLLVVKEKCGRYTLIREPLYLDRCVVCSEADWDEYFEIQEISSKDTFIFKAEDNVRTKQWYTQLQYHAQGMGAWRKRRNALANIMINGMLTRS